MCGICGELTWDGSNDVDAVIRMTSAMSHRGPDADGLWKGDGIVLGHRRLSIIDTDSRSNQPMSSADGRYKIVYNGEIYNFIEIKKNLESQGFIFKTNSDTEVIIESYRRWGVDCLAHFNGMFSFALWDDYEKILLLARDRFGEKPLFYFRNGSRGLVFASELRSLMCHPACPRDVSYQGVSEFLTHGYTLAETTMIEGVRRLEAASWMMIDTDGPRQPKLYWDLASKFKTKSRYRSDDEAAEALTALLDDAVKLRMISDVPLGAFLSGGVDSGSIVSSMVKLGGQSVRTFSAGDLRPENSSKFG